MDVAGAKTQRAGGSAVARKGGVVVVAGPDGAGKTTLTRELMNGPLGPNVHHFHHRPGVFPKRSDGEETTDPRAKPPYGPLLSLLKALYVWLDYCIGWFIRIRPLARTEWVVLERGWDDLRVDPLRYRIRSSRALIAILSRFVPSADATIVLEAPAEDLAKRKAELPQEELARQARVWRSLARRGFAFVDATVPIAETVAASVKAIERTSNAWGAGWVRLGSRWILPRGPRRVASEALRIYQPVTIRGLFAWYAARNLARIGAFRLLPAHGAPPQPVIDALAGVLIPDGTLAVARSGDPDTYIALILDADGRAAAIGTVATSADARERLARKEAASRASITVPFAIPELVYRSANAVLYRPMNWSPRLRAWRVPASLAAQLGKAFAMSPGLSHGDFAPWNVLRLRRGAWGVIDWEESGTAGSPFFDLFHYLVQGHALLRRPTRRALLRGIGGRGWVGRAIRAYAESAGCKDADVEALLVSYLEYSIPRVDLSRPEGARERRVREELLHTIRAQDDGRPNRALMDRPRAARSAVMKIGMGWGIVDQGFSSVTNFAVSVLAGRLLGPHGLGIVFIGFAAYLIVLEFQQSLIQEPLVVTSAVTADTSATRSAVTAALVYQVCAAVAMFGLGHVIPGTLGRGLQIVAPWMIPLLFQDLCRTILFRDRRGAAATGCDAVWAVGMALALPIAIAVRTPAAVVSCWALGATAGALYGLGMTRIQPNGLREMWLWWRTRISPLAKWLGLESAGLVAGTQGSVFLIAVLAGAGNLGGLRAVQAAFAPMTLVGPAIRMPGLPAIARALHNAPGEEGQKAARNVAITLSAAATTMVVAYFIVVVAVGREILEHVFGHAFLQFKDLILPVGIGQLAFASALGYYLLLKATGRGKAVFWTRIVSSSSRFAFIFVLGRTGSIYGAAWGSSIGAAIGWIAVTATAFRRRKRSTAPPEVATAGTGRAVVLDVDADGSSETAERLAIAEPHSLGADS